MRKYLTIKIASVILATGLFSCNSDNFFEVTRPQEPQWVNTVTYDQGLATAYYNVLYSLQASPQMIDFASSGIAQLLPGTSTGAPWNEMYYRQFNNNFNLTNDIWTRAYASITMCNQALELNDTRDNNAFNLPVTGSDYKDNYQRQVGEYYFVRAYAYYLLTRYFAPPYVQNGANNVAYIPFKTVVPKTRGEVLAEKLGTNEEIYKQMVADLKKAKDLLPLAYNSATMHPTYITGRATKYTASAMLGKILFLMGDYPNASLEMDFIISAAETSNRFVMEAPIEPFNKVTVATVPKEDIWEFNTGDPTGTNTSMYIYWGWVFSLQDRDADNFGRGGPFPGSPGMSKSPTNQFTMSYWAIDKMGWMADPINGDYTITQAAKNDLRFQQVYYSLLPYKANATPAEYFTHETLAAHNKVDKPQIYVDKAFRGGPGDGRYSKYPMIRLAEIYLLRSWFRWKANNLLGAAQDLNKVYNRSNPTTPDKYTIANVNHNAILGEYIKEMAGEATMLDFIFGTQMPVPAGDRPATADIPAPYSVWKWAIPAAEKALNPNYK